MNRLTAFALLAAMFTAAAAPAHAGLDTIDLDSHFRAKIAKEKIRAAEAQREADAKSNGAAGGRSASCGSQSIGNFDSGGRIGTAPREIFVFAPNAINIASRGACN